MKMDKIIYQKEGNIAKIILNDSQRQNLWDFPGQGGLTDQFFATLDKVKEDDQVKVLVIKSSGESFSAGHDFDANPYDGPVFGAEDVHKPGERRASERNRFKVHREWLRDLHFEKLFLCPKVTIAQINGHCSGEGTMILCECDFAVAAEDAQIGHPEQKLGYAGGGLPTIPHLILSMGLKRALYLLLTGSTISGKEAAETGLVSKSVPLESLEEEVIKLAQAVALLPRDGIAIGKATRHLLFDQLGLTAGYTIGYYSHTLLSNMVWEPDEYSFFQERLTKGTETSLREVDERYKNLK
jgi:enoyl-CoA hydratase